MLRCATAFVLMLSPRWLHAPATDAVDIITATMLLSPPHESFLVIFVLSVAACVAVLAHRSAREFTVRAPCIFSFARLLSNG